MLYAPIGSPPNLPVSQCETGPPTSHTPVRRGRGRLQILSGPIKLDVISSWREMGKKMVRLDDNLAPWQRHFPKIQVGITGA